MSNLTHAIAEIKNLATKANLSVEQFASAAEVLDQRQEEIYANNRASPESRQAIDAYLEGIDGAINPDMPASDICAKAGAPVNRGTSQYATRAKQRLLAHMSK